MRNIVCNTLVAALSVSAVQPVTAQKGEKRKSPKPVNLVVFIADDLGAEDIGPYGNKVVRTPNLDKLASESVLFSRAFACSPTSSPSRASIHTGMYPVSQRGSCQSYRNIGRSADTARVLAENGIQECHCRKIPYRPYSVIPL